MITNYNRQFCTFLVFGFSSAKRYLIKMPQKARNSHSSPKLLPETSSTRSKHHRRIPQPNYYYHSEDDDNNNVDTHLSQYSPNESSNGDELEQPENESYDYDDEDGDYHASDFQSESISNNAPKTLASLNSVSNSATSSYINIAPLPIFHGNPEECPMTHLSMFAKVCRANNAVSIEMMMRIFPVTLLNEAGLWYDLNIEPYPSLTWEEIKASFLQAYNKTQVKEQLRNELTTMNQGNEECVRSYFLRLQWVLQRWPDHGMSENLVKDIFVDGLREDFQDWVINRKPESIGEALRLAFAYEQLKSIKVCSRKNQSNGVVGENDERDMVSGKMISQCQCSKHHCWKKQLNRTNSLMSRCSNAL